MICIDCKIDKDPKHFRKYKDKDGYVIQRHQCYSCLGLRTKLRKQEKLSKNASNEQTEVLVIPDNHKLCTFCNVVKPIYKFSKSKLGNIWKYCKTCTSNRTQTKMWENKNACGGSERIPTKCNVYVDIYQKQQTFWLMQLLGWKFNDNGIWSKENIKDETGKWLIFNEQPKKRRYPNHRGGRKILPIHQKKEEIVKQYENGTTPHELSYIYKCSHTSIRKLLRDYYNERGTD